MAGRAAGAFTTRERGSIEREGQGMIERHGARSGVRLGREGWAVQDIADTSMTREREEECELGRVVTVQPLIGVSEDDNHVWGVRERSDRRHKRKKKQMK